jgi:hypothetical protein
VGKKKKKKPFSLSVEIHCDSYNFAIAESEYDNRIALSLSSVKGEEIKLKNYL